MIFLTVGTQFGFDRLVKAVDDAIGSGEIVDVEVFAQIGGGGYEPVNMQFVRMLDKGAFDEKVCQADALIGHSGIGTIVMAMEKDKPLLVMPRRKKYGELVNEHQLGTAKKFEQLGHIMAVYEEDELAVKISELKSFRPSPRKADPQRVCDRIKGFLESL
jgi:beta-1,4-N-acetylglucosaminyltransferase